ncbi:MAG: ParB/RepB/Spo0J family partition protein [Oscillospiraceae bacterium]
MADEKKTTGHEEQAPPAGLGGSKAPPAPQAEQQPVQLGIENLDAPASDKKAEKSGPDHAAPVAEPKDGSKIPDGKVIDITGKVALGTEAPAPGDDKKAAKADPEKTGQDAPAKKGKTKAGPEKADKAPTPRKGTKDKSASDKGQRDKVSQGKAAPERPAAGGGSGPGSAPATKAPAEPTPPPRPVEEGKLVYLKLSELHPFHTFRAHPFKVRDDAKMQETVASIKENGVMVPGLARPEKDGNGYELIAGHRRHRGSELAGLTEMPFIVREMSDHEAVQAMKDSNKQREQTLPSELAALLDLEVEDIKHQGTKLKGVAEGDIGKRSVEIVGEAHDMNYKKVMRYLRLNSLVPELLDKVDAKTMGFMPAVELSYIRPKNQRLIAVSIDGEQASPSVAQAKRLRELDKDGKLTGDIIDGILSEEKKEVDRVIITTDELNKYFGKEFTPRQMKDQIMALLDDWKEKQPPALDKPQQER